ncbi:hypothetical protein [Oceanobacillus massiliensis]|uniref:hypothetical protein n=1 Tax=Oceanobacillus massiliensis TaxID=1465765 RepID=UPI003019F4C0
MDFLLWTTIGFFIIGFVVLVSMKKGMENKIAYIKANMEDEENPKKANSVIWWIMSVTVWGLVSMMLVVWWFHNHFG